MSQSEPQKLKKGARIGPAGWSYKDWQGVVYPQKRSRTFSELEYLANYFDTIEINSTFYRPPRPNTSLAWVQRVQHNPRFEFTVKLWQRFTHERGSLISAEIRTFKDAINPLLEAERLGALLIQFPWSFKNSDESRQYLLQLSESFNEYPCVVEFRHKSWQQAEVFEFLHDHNIGFVNIDQPVIGNSISPSSELTSDIAYVRFHGRNYDNWFRQGAGRDERYDYLYSESELVEWIKDLKSLATQAKKSFYIYNNHFRGQAVVNGLQLLAKLQSGKVKVPEPLLTHYPQIREIAIPAPNQELSLF